MRPAASLEEQGEVTPGVPDRIRSTVYLEVDGRTISLLASLVAAELATQASHEEDRWLSVDEAAEYIRSPPSRIYDLVAQRRIRFAKDGRRVLSRRSWLDAYLAEATVEPARLPPRCHPAGKQ